MTPRRRLNPAILAGLAFLACAVILQEGVVWHLAILGIAPSLVLLLVTNWSLLGGVEEGMLWGLIGGAYLDIFSGLPFGTSAVAFVAVAGLLSLGETALMRSTVLLPLLAAALGTIVYYVVAIVVVASVNHQLLLTGSTLHIFAGVLIYNVVVNPLIYVVCRGLDEKLHPMQRTVW